MTQFRSRDEFSRQVEDLAEDIAIGSSGTLFTRKDLASRHIEKAEARGAAEQRRKDAEGVYQTLNEDGRWSAVSQDEYLQAPYEGRRIIPANVAALEARVKVLEAALKTADQFITNGIEFGFIRMPDSDTPDSALATPGIIRAALTREGGV